ncbi:Uma2 family endonuclease [Butyrivibrio sp. WCD3002]|uniref:Uma2 family endonuclease n=1 Tax=Butyrivibrio sp. WCD3002 TaxID=1280676 RepID=UPI00042A3A01|nr:Uma2 family endonuclease [Butyrivibrio sp. WCD3002]
MTIEEMNRIKDSRGYSFTQLSDYTGVPVVTLQRIFSGNTKNPRKATLDAIEKVLEGDESKYFGKAYSYEQSSVIFSDRGEKLSELAESSPSYGSKKNGEYTVEDYYALPEDQWVELIDGVFYDMTAPRPVHQIISSAVFNTIYNFIRSNKGDCIPLYSPIDVQLDCDDRTMVQPDVVIVCDEDKIRDRVIYGAPDFVLEILSPSTRRKDMFIKSEKYCNAGVKEYWMIDPKKRFLIVYNFTDEDVTPEIMPLEGDYPMNIYDGKLRIDLDEVNQIIERFSK